MARKIPRRGDRRRPDDVIALADRRGLRQAISSPMPAGGIGHSSLGPNQGLLPNVQPSSASLALTGGAMNNATGRPYPQMPTVSDTRPNLNVYGATGTAIFGGIITSEEYHPDFFWRDAVKIYEQMLRGDGMVNGLRLALEQPLKAATWSIVPASNDPVDVEIASFVESCLFHDMQYQTADGATLRQTWDYTLHHILMHLWYGFSALEQVWRVEDGLVKWARWTPLLPRTVWRWWVGPDNELAGIQQWTFRDYTYQFINIPAGKLLLFVHRQEGNNYEGVSLLRTAYKHWWYVQNFEKIEAVGLERNAFAIPVVYLPNPFTASDLSYAQTVAQNIRVNELAGVTLPGPKGHPEGFELDYPHQAGRGMPQVQPSVQYHLTQMARNVLATWIMNGSQENGTRAMDGSQRSGFLDALQGTASYIEDVLNQQAIRRLVDYNYVDVGVYPQVRCSRLRAQDLDALSSALQALGPQGGNFLTPTPETEDMLRKQLGLPSAPLSQVESTNPAYQPLDGGTAGESGDEATADENEGGYQQATDAQNQQQDQEPRMAPGDQSPAAGSAAALVELRTEAMLLREALDAAYGRDAVERGTVRLSGGHEPGYTQNRDSHGHWAPGEGGEHGAALESLRVHAHAAWLHARATGRSEDLARAVEAMGEHASHRAFLAKNNQEAAQLIGMHHSDVADEIRAKGYALRKDAPAQPVGLDRLADHVTFERPAGTPSHGGGESEQVSEVQPVQHAEKRYTLKQGGDFAGVGRNGAPKFRNQDILTTVRYTHPSEERRTWVSRHSDGTYEITHYANREAIQRDEPTSSEKGLTAHEAQARMRALGIANTHPSMRGDMKPSVLRRMRAPAVTPEQVREEFDRLWRTDEQGLRSAEEATVKLMGGHLPGYDAQAHGYHGHWEPGQGEQSGGGAGGDGGRQRAQAEADREAGRGGGGGGSAAGGHNPKPRNAKAATARAKGKTEAEAKGDGGKSEHSYPERTQEIASKLRAREVDPHAPVDVHYVRAALGDSHLAEHLGNFDVATLRESATYHGLSKTGSKAALIDRLVQHATSVTPDESVRIANANVEKHGGDNNRGTSFHIQRDEAGHLLNRSAEVTSVATAAGGHNPKPRNAKAAGAATARSKGKAEAEGGARGGEKAATKPAAAKGEARSEGKAEAEGIHDRSARLQREGGLRAEAKPGVPLTPLRDIGDEGIDPYAKLDPGKLAHIYGEHQLGAALTVYSTTKLREAAKQAGMEKLPGKAHSEMVSNLVAHVTRGRYSANFPELRQAEAEVAAKKAAAKAERAANPKAPRQAKAKAADAKDERPVLRARPLTADQIKGFTGEDATGQDATGEARINPYAKPNAYHIHALYGGEQLHAALGVYSMSHLREMANIVHDRLNEQGVAHTKPTGKTRDQLAKSLADTVIAHPQAPFFAGEYGDGGYGEGMHGAATHSAKEQQKQPLGEGDKRHFAKPAGEVTPGKD